MEPLGDVSCGICRFWESIDNKERLTGICRRRAPAPPTNKAETPWYVWPKTAVDDWCGEFKLIR